MQLKLDIIAGMSCVNLKQQFLSYVDFNPHQSSYWNPPAFMKSSNQILTEVETLTLKFKQLEAILTRNRLRNSQQQQAKMMHNLKESIKLCEAHLKRLQIMTPDMKCTQKFAQQYKNSILATVQMKLLGMGMKFKNIYQQSKKKSHGLAKTPASSQLSKESSTPNLNRPLFIDQTQEQLMEEAAVNEYMDIEKSISKISEMYKETASIVRMHEYMIDSIESDINQTEVHVEGGRKHLADAHRRQSKNRPLIIKVFAMLYLLSGVYIVVLS